MDLMENILPESFALLAEIAGRDGSLTYRLVRPGGTDPDELCYRVLPAEGKVRILCPGLGACRLYLASCAVTAGREGNIRSQNTFEQMCIRDRGVRRLCGTTFADLTPRVQAGQPVEAFAVLPYAGNALYLGFDRPMEGGPVSILFEVEENPNLEELPLRFEYSTREGFETLRVVDRTHGLSETGTVLFLPPSQFARREVEGKNRWWLRIVEDRGPLEGGSRTFPLLKRILPNAVEIRNRVTMPEEVFYICLLYTSRCV